MACRSARLASNQERSSSLNRLIDRANIKDDALLVDEVPDGSVFSTTGKNVPGSAGLQTNNPGWPGFSSAGWVWGGGITVEVPL